MCIFKGKYTAQNVRQLQLSIFACFLSIPIHYWTFLKCYFLIPRTDLQTTVSQGSIVPYHLSPLHHFQPLPVSQKPNTPDSGPQGSGKTLDGWCIPWQSWEFHFRSEHPQNVSHHIFPSLPLSGLHGRCIYTILLEDPYKHIMGHLWIHREQGRKLK